MAGKKKKKKKERKVGAFLLILNMGKNITNGKEEADRLQGRF